MWRQWLLWKLFGIKFAVLFDFDGEAHIRRVRGSRTGIPQAHRHGFGIAIVTLLPKGDVTGVNYVVAWRPAFVPWERGWKPIPGGKAHGIRPLEEIWP